MNDLTLKDLETQVEKGRQGHLTPHGPFPIQTERVSVNVEDLAQLLREYRAMHRDLSYAESCVNDYVLNARP